MTHPYLAGARPRVLAHRGLVTPQAAGEGVLENSIAAFAAAHAAGVTYVETDARSTSDGVAVLFHDESLERVFGDGRRVGDIRLSELERLFATRGGLATLSDALATFPTLRFNVDVKSADAVAPVARAVAAAPERVLVTSFDDGRRRATLEHIRDLAPRHPSSHPTLPAQSAGMGVIARFWLTGLIPVPGLRDAIARRVLAGIDALQVPERAGVVRLVTRGFVRRAHRAGVEVHVWTVNDTADMTRLVALGVDGVVTDRADRAIAVLARR
jgi:glycerophosphoryl diester phosphodiesterase